MQCWDCSTTETLRVRRQGRALPLALGLVVGAGVGSVCPWTPRMLLTPDM